LEYFWNSGRTVCVPKFQCSDDVWNQNPELETILELSRNIAGQNQFYLLEMEDLSRNNIAVEISKKELKFTIYIFKMLVI